MVLSIEANSGASQRRSMPKLVRLRIVQSRGYRVTRYFASRIGRLSTIWHNCAALDESSEGLERPKDLDLRLFHRAVVGDANRRTGLARPRMASRMSRGGRFEVRVLLMSLVWSSGIPLVDHAEAGAL